MYDFQIPNTKNIDLCRFFTCFGVKFPYPEMHGHVQKLANLWYVGYRGKVQELHQEVFNWIDAVMILEK